MDGWSGVIRFPKMVGKNLKGNEKRRPKIARRNFLQPEICFPTKPSMPRHIIRKTLCIHAITSFEILTAFQFDQWQGLTAIQKECPSGKS
jgi:lauroyl/myristoyl acyltransferase